MANSLLWHEPHNVAMAADGTKIEQSHRFREAARDVEADQSDDALEKAFKRLNLTRKPEDEKKPKED